jgi:hypothetical protein
MAYHPCNAVSILFQFILPAPLVLLPAMDAAGSWAEWCRPLAAALHVYTSRGLIEILATILGPPTHIGVPRFIVHYHSACTQGALPHLRSCIPLTPLLPSPRSYLLIHEVALHSAKEEMVLYPAIKGAMGGQAAGALLAGHQTLKETLYELDGLRVGQQGFEDKVHQAMKVGWGGVYARWTG